MKKLLLALLLFVAPNLYAQSYTTAFPLTENPISEGHNWINGGVCGDPTLCVGIDWKNVQTSGGFAFGTEVDRVNFDDSTAVVSGTWGPNQTVTAQVSNTDAAEMEIRLHTTITPHNITGYEILCIGGPVMQVVRWEGPLNAFTIIGTGTTPCVPNDIFKGTIVNNTNGSVTIQAFINNVLALTVTDSGANGPVFRTGNPGMGFFNDGNLPVTVNKFKNFTATATGAPITATLIPSSLTFASQNVGSTSPGQNVTLTNTSGAGTNLTVSGISITGTNANNFNQTNGCPGTLASGAACTITVNFTPSATGTRTASLTVSTNAGTLTTSLTGTGAGTTAGPPWSAILAPSRAIDWSGAGLPGTLPDGETTANPWTPPTGRTQCGSTIAAYSGTADTINNALIACAGLGGRYVLLGPGTFTISTNIWFRNGSTGLSAVTLRGSGAGGANQTKINFTGNAQVQFGLASGAGFCTWSGGFAVGLTSLTTSSCSGTIQIGTLLGLSICDTGFTGPIASQNSGTGCLNGTSADNGGIYICGNNTACQLAGQPAGGPQQHQYQYVTVTGVSGATVNFTPAIRMPNYSTANVANVQWTPSDNNVYGNGLEDLTIFSNTSNSNDGIVGFKDTSASWIKGVRIIGITDATVTSVRISSGKNNLIANSYIDTNYEAAGGPPQDPILEGSDSDALIINTMIVGGSPWVGTGAATGNVLAYNYSRDTQTEYNENSNYQHSAGGAFSLYEGNQFGKTNEDDTHGTHNLNTWFRNYYRGWDSPYITCAAASCITHGIDDFARFDNIIGDALGGPYITTYEGSGAPNNVVYEFDHSGKGDTLAKASLMRWGNCDTSITLPVCKFNSSEVPINLSGNAAPLNNNVNGGPGVPGTQNLPCSFFLKGYNTTTTCSPHPSGNTGLSWWKVCTAWATFPTSCSSFQTPPFPTVGPDVTGGPNVSGHAWDNPAAIAWSKLPIDPAYQVAYAIQSSSWSAGTETLTFAAGVLPGLHRLMGGFQITGAPLCNSATGAEFQMTGSSATTVRYALAADPGVNACANGGAGRMRFPDVRQFDQRVYSLDSGGLPTAGTPTAAPSAGTFTTTQNVALSTTSGPVICYSTTTTPVTNGTTGCTTGTLYTTPVSIAVTTTLRAVAGGTGFVDSNVFTGVYTIAAVTPVATPPGGTYTTTQNVVLSTTTSGAAICFTQDGSTPTASNGTCTHGSTYASPISVSSTQTIQALATKAGLTNSGILSATYNFNPVAATPVATPPAGTYATAQSVTLTTTSGGATGPSFTATTCNQSDVNAVINGPTHVAVNGDVIHIPAGTCTWTSPVTINGKGITIIGTGTTNTLPSQVGAGASSTILTHNVAGGVLFHAIAIPFGQTMRISTMTMQPIASPPNGYVRAAIGLVGVCTASGCPSVRVDNITFPNTWSVNVASSGAVILEDNVFGVFDHNTSSTTGPFLTFIQSALSSYLGVGANGDNSWAQPDTMGTAQSIYIENNDFSLVGAYDSDVNDVNGGFGGPRVACRYNNYHPHSASGACSTAHGTSWNGRLRGPRQTEMYRNTDTYSGAYDTWSGFVGGTGRVFQNNVTASMNKLIALTNERDWHSSSPYWYCDGAQPWDTNDGVTYASGSVTTGGQATFSDNTKAWTVNQWFQSGLPYSVHDVTQNIGGAIFSNTATQYSLDGNFLYQTWNIGDSYQILRASVCLDQPARGKSIYYSGTGCGPGGVGPCPANPANQPLDPIYEWNDTISTSPPVITSSTPRLLANRDWYAETVHQAAQSNPTTPFSGGSGTGHGTLANRPTTCTTGVGYWATDQGSWNISGDGRGSGQFYICTAPNTWTLDYAPFTYPHPLLGGSAVICYTTDGVTVPHTNGSTGCTVGTLYTSPINVASTTTILAKAGGSGFSDSNTLTAPYIINSVALAPSITPGTGTYTSPQTVSMASGSVGAIICYTVNGATPATNGTTGCSSGSLYSSPITVSTAQTVKAIAGGSNFTDSAVTSAVFSFRAAQPTAAPGSGTYTATQSVVLSTTTGSVICYTTNGTAPVTDTTTGCTNGTHYTVPISISTSQILKAVAGGTGFVDSTVATFTYTINAIASTPTFIPVAGTYSGSQSVTITSASPGAIKCYTTDGWTPATNGTTGCTAGTLYSGPVTVASSLTVKAIAGGSNFTDSAVASAAYVITTPVATPTFSPVAGTYTGTQNVTISTTTGSATLCYTIDGSTPTGDGAGTCTHGTTYTVPVVVATSLTLKAVGTKSGNSDSAVASAGYVISLVASTPTANPVAGTYTGAQSVSLSTASAGAIICYSTTSTLPHTNGAAACSSGTLYSGAITVAATTTILAVAGGSGFTDSSTATFVYTINTVAIAPALTPGTGTYTSTQSVSMSTPSVSAIICYTINGTTPQTNGGAGCTTGSLYSAPVSVSVAETIKAIAGGTGYTDSLVTTATYSFRATAPTATPGAGTYTGTQSVVLTTPVGGVICYTINGTTPVTDGSTNCTTGTKYTGAISVATTETILAVAGGTGFVDSTVSSFLYRINTLAATPVFSLPAGTYSGSQSLTITAVPSSVICVTTSGATPATDGASGCSSGTVYSGTITISTSETVKAIAGGTGFTDGSVTSAAYVITTPVATPTFNPPSGTYSGTQSVVISTATSAATLCYTIDNTTPTANGAGVCTHGSTYVGPVSIAVNTTLKAIGSKAGNSDSAVATANYVITQVASTPRAVPLPGTYSSSQSVLLSTASLGAIICYTVNGSIPSTDGVSGCTVGTLYSGAITVSVTTTILARAGGTGFTDSAVLSAAYVINNVAVAPSITPGTGTYASSQSVTLATSSSGAIICYTTNGATPVPSGASCSVGTLFTVAITVSTAQTLKAVAGGTGFTNSLVSTAVYSFSASAVVATPGAGSYTGTQNITLTKTIGTVICYSTSVTPATNGAAGCSAGTLYSTPVAIASSQTLRAVAGGTGFVDGPVSSFVYVINSAPPPAPAIVIFSLLRNANGANTNVSASWTDTPNLSNTFWWYNSGVTLSTGTQANASGSYSTSWTGKVHPNSAITFEVCDVIGCLTRLI